MTRHRARCADESGGFALAIVLVALLVLAAVASGALVAASGQRRAAQVAGQAVAGRTLARGTVERALVQLGGWASASVGDTAEVVAEGTAGVSNAWRVRSMRISPEYHLVVAEAGPESGFRMREARLVWWLDPLTRVAGHAAVVEADSVRVDAGGRVEADSLLAARGALLACDSAQGGSGVLGGVAPATGALPAPPEWGAHDGDGNFEGLRLGWLGSSELAAFAAHEVAPGGVWSPSCSDCWAGLVFGSGDLELAASGAGLLLVDGDVATASGVRWTGVLVASGDVELSTGAEVVGLLRAGGVVRVAATSAVQGSVCAAIAAVETAMSLARPIPAPERSWLVPLPPAAG